jgi:hypothetical protein
MTRAGDGLGDRPPGLPQIHPRPTTHTILAAPELAVAYVRLATPVSEDTCQPAVRQAAVSIPWHASTTAAPRATPAISAGSTCPNSGHAVSTAMTSALGSGAYFVFRDGDDMPGRSKRG